MTIRTRMTTTKPTVPQIAVHIRMVRTIKLRRKEASFSRIVKSRLSYYHNIQICLRGRRIACGLRLYTISVFLIVGRATGGSSAWQSFRASVGQRILAGGDAVDVCQRWASPSLPGVHADTGLSQVQILPARLKLLSPK